MCLGPSGPSAAEKRAAAEQRAAAEEAKQAEIQRRAEQKREDIEGAVEASTMRSRGATRGGYGRRSLFTSSAGQAGYLSRF